MKICVLASGSRGNSVYIAGDRVRLVVDAGLSGQQTRSRLELIGVRAEDLDAIVVTHEHTDHIYGLGPLARRHGLCVYLNRATFSQLPDRVGKLDEKKEFITGRSFSIGDLTIHPFSVSHDAADPVGLTVAADGVKVGLCTDLGRGTRLVEHHLRDCDLLVLEANHDPEMLTEGPYPWAVKQRIKGKTGHLSNEESGVILAQVFSDRLQQVILAHLSEVTNSPEKVMQAFSGYLHREGWDHVRLSVASQDHPTGLFHFDCWGLP
ncbi:MAG: MBL fold metallo-hydrolase [Syntrophobacteria bacterium]